MRTRIDIETQTFVRFWLVVIGFAVAGLAIYSARDALVILGVAFFLAMALNRPVVALANHLPGKSRVGGTALAFIIVVVLLGGFLFLVIPPILEQTSKVADSIPALVDQVQNQWQGLTHFAQRYGMEHELNQALDSIKSSASGWAGNLAQNIGAGLVSSVGSLLGFLTATFLVLVLSFLMLVEGPKALKFIWSAYADEDLMEYHKKLTSRMYTVVTGYVTGQLTVSAIDGFFAGVTVFILSWIFNIPHNLALPAAVICFLLSLIPMFGATIAGVLVCILLAFNDVSAALVFALYFVIYQQIENNFISPTVQSKTVELTALAVLASVTIGLYLFGIAGGIISIPIAGCVKVLVEDYLERKRRRHHRENSQAKLAKET
jgi:predicted PurR-regulated permease PerM